LFAARRDRAVVAVFMAEHVKHFVAADLADDDPVGGACAGVLRVALRGLPA
jgi:hypothetical protein